MATVQGGNRLSKILTEMADNIGDGQVMVRIGFLEGATYPTGPTKHLSAKSLDTGHKGGKVRKQSGSPGGQPVAMIAAIQSTSAQTGTTNDLIARILSGQRITPPAVPSRYSTRRESGESCRHSRGT